ncbi:MULTISPECIES: DUF2935 domain-containing protein [unclassified Dehalobacter]|uniref:DUF2935 domain-containing protein n=1 Tax=unclassified Dehalobacter TaxID=2635733 RepID=UPI00039BE25D|nr:MULTISPECIES: DUF2935 domain-containing protein [unclassified Dehalobacter]RJE48971.1 hypothetical protein A7K50_07585 [Dehalobacter sp. MCB1]TCX51708.1 DUF2935 domain-containing protein [Dehalobacter sp. 14DCB1]TCX52768.1 DUF2935 domain-containing protein [Dehalobacter sp. 12DCB1]
MNAILLPGDFVRESLELHLFFGRIMKEHSIFLEAGFVAKDAAFARQADMFKTQFAELLREAVFLANGVISEETLSSGESITDKTLRAEQITEELSGIAIESVITNEEFGLTPNTGINPAQLEAQVTVLNQKAISLTNALVQFKTNILNGMLQCKLFTFNFPLLIIHIRREALFYINHLERLQRHMAIDFVQEAIEEEKFWNRQMAEHAQFIRHLLDPTESSLIVKAEGFDREFHSLEQRVPAAQKKTDIGRLTRETITATRALRDFKAAGTEGLLTCKIKSIIIPLLADHVLREANHYLRILNRSKRDLQL